MRAATFLLRAPRAALSRLWRDCGGAAAVEFAYIAPILVLMLLATIEVGRAVNIHRHFAMVTAMAGDLVAREEWIGTSNDDAKRNLDSMMKSIKHVMQPYDAATLKLGIFQVRASPNDASKTKVEWTYAHNGMAVPSKCQQYALPSGLIGKGESAIVVETSYAYKPLFANVVPGLGAINWTDRSLHSPRNSCVDYVKPSGNACLSSC